MTRFFLFLLCACYSVVLVGLPVSDSRLDNAASEPGNWLSHGKTYSEKRFSPLTSINEKNVNTLGLSWYFDTPFNNGVQATPLVVDGIMYTTGEWSIVYALDARTGKLLWRYDPEVSRAYNYRFCCGAVNRGVAIWQSRLFVGTLDGRLIAIDATNGNPLWQTQTTDLEKNYSITGAPRVVNGKVIIGNGGSEFGVRGYVSAYDAETGEMLWRFYTVPGDPKLGFENPQMEMAAKTWTGEWWTMGGGGTVWDSIAFDPSLNLLYIGVGNGGPHNRDMRSPGGGDNLFLTSIIALNPDTGEYVWHHQQVLGDSWDYTATQQMVLIDTEWQGQQRKLLMQAPKAGFFYIYDRETGELLSAEPFVKVNWASGYDMNTGRPIENPAARYPKGTKTMVYPMGLGAHNWHSMAYSPETGLMYIPAMDFGTEFEQSENFDYFPRQWNLGYKANGPKMDQQLTQVLIKSIPESFLLAWDPIQQKEVWRANYPFMPNGGTLATAGNLVFQGSVDGYFYAYKADTGERLWTSDVQNTVMAAPISYRVDGEQYVSVMAGRGGGFSMMLGIEHPRPNINGRLLTFKLGGTVKLPPIPQSETLPEPVAMLDVTEAQMDRGQFLYNRYCARCHGVNAVSDGSAPDLRHLPKQWHDNFQNVVLNGMMAQAGMPGFDDVLNEEDTRFVQSYIIYRSHEDRRLKASSGAWLSVKEWVYERVAVVLRWLMALQA